MAGLTERRWLGVIQTFALDGGTDGTITVTDTEGFHTKQQVQLVSATVARTIYEVKRVISSTQLAVGLTSTSIDNRTDVSAYLVGDGAQIQASEQQRPGIDYVHVLRHVYQEEPAVALRVMEVDQYGNPVGAGGIAENVNVDKWGGTATTLGQKPMASSVPVTIASDQMVLSNPLITEPFDAIGAAYPDALTEEYSYFQGGLGGTLVGLVTVKYTTAAKDFVASVVRT